MFKQYAKSGVEPDIRILLMAAWRYLKCNNVKRTVRLFGGISKEKLPLTSRDGYALVEAEIFLRKGNLTGAAEKPFTVLGTSPESWFKNQIVETLKEAILGLESQGKGTESACTYPWFKEKAKTG